jgi:predicted nucleic acid-binding protein
VTHAVLIDTGPLVAIASPWDQHHAACVEQLHELRPPLVTTWSVLTEVIWLLRNDEASIMALCQLIQEGWLLLPQLGWETFAWYEAFRRRYAKVSPDLADATLVYLAEQTSINRIFTLDRRDFSIYRIGKKRAFQLLPTSL